MGDHTIWGATGESDSAIVPVDFWVVLDKPVMSKEDSCSIYYLDYWHVDVFSVSLNFHFHFYLHFSITGRKNCSF